MKQFLLFITISIFLLVPISVNGQRKMEKLDRGIVAMAKSSSQFYISWRHFSSDPDEIAYNVYCKVNDGAFTKLNATPITNSTNYQTATGVLNQTNGDHTFIIKSVLNGVEIDESGSFTVTKNKSNNRIVKEIDFAPLPVGMTGTMSSKYCWVGDLTGDGKFDFVLDRFGGTISDDEEEGSGSGLTGGPFLEGYSFDGDFLWRITIRNATISSGHSDMVTVYDMNGDGKAEVLAVVGPGTTFPNGEVITLSDGTIPDYTGKGTPFVWIAIINGETGNLIDKMELPFFNEIAVTSGSDFMTGHFIIAYVDGINPSLIYQYKTKASGGGGICCVGYTDSKLKTNWARRSSSTEIGRGGHQVRVADVDGDGKDEFVQVSYTIDHDGTLLPYPSDDIRHGDRHMLGDIDPDRPGLEHFFIQQSSIMGSGLWDPATSEVIKGNYMGSPGDVGRGVCGAMKTNIRGLQYFSYVSNLQLFNCKGNPIEGAFGTATAEMLWWGPGLSRYMVTSPGSAGRDLVFYAYNQKTDRLDRQSPNFYSEGGQYYLKAYGSGRAQFWGDILGDWREEMVLLRADQTGFAIVSTWDVTDHRQYCMAQNPAYRSQMTHKGYYETPDVDFYMAWDMPLPPIAPVQTADLYYKGSGSWVNASGVNQTYANGKSIMFDIRSGGGTYTMNGTMSPNRVLLMNPKGLDYTLEGGKFTGSMDLIKSLQGTATLKGNQDYTGVTRISEGRLFIEGDLTSPVYVNARGVIGGTGKLKGGIILEEGLNIEGGRIEPGLGSAGLGTLTIQGNLTLPGRNTLAFDIDPNGSVVKSDLLEIQGDFIVSDAIRHFIHITMTDRTPCVYTLVSFTGTTDATAAKFKVVGLEGTPHTLFVEDNKLKIQIKEPRTAGSVAWMGTENSLWDFESLNFNFEDNAYAFVPGDNVTFNDNAENKTVTIEEETMPVSGLIFNNNQDYSIEGQGAIGGDGSLKKTGTGILSLKIQENTFTGKVEIEDGVLEVASLKNGGIPSSIGASSKDSTNWIMKNATLRTLAQLSTDRNMTASGKLTLDIPSSTSLYHTGRIGKPEGENMYVELAGKGRWTLRYENEAQRIQPAYDSIVVTGGADLTLGDRYANEFALGSTANTKTKVILKDGIFRFGSHTVLTDMKFFYAEVNVPKGSEAAKWVLTTHWHIGNKLTGAGTIEVNFPGDRCNLRGSDWSEFTGKINFTGKSIRFLYDQPKSRNIPNAEVNLGSGTSMYVSGTGGEDAGTYDITLGALSGSGSIAGRNNLFIGNKNIDTEFSGLIRGGGGKLTKVGTGILTLSNGTNAHTGGTSVEGGTLSVINTSGSATGTGAVNVLQNASLAGTGIISGAVTIKENASIKPGLAPSGIGTLSLGNNLKLEAGANTEIEVSGAGNDKLAVTGDIELNGTLNIINTGAAYAEGNSYTIFTAGGNVSGEFQNILPATPGEGLTWDLSEINAGIIKVAAASGIDKLEGATIGVYPTVVKDYCYVSLTGLNKKAKVEVLDLWGVILFSEQIQNNTDAYRIDMSRYDVGAYLIKVSTDKNAVIRKVIKK